MRTRPVAIPPNAWSPLDGHEEIRENATSARRSKPDGIGGIPQGWLLGACVSRVRPDGDTAWRVAAMPTQEVVQSFFQALLTFDVDTIRSHTTLFEEVVAADLFEPIETVMEDRLVWYGLLGRLTEGKADDSAELVMPSETWADPLTEADTVLIDLACRLLGTELITLAVNTIRGVTRPPEWTRIEPYAERLLRRLHHLCERFEPNIFFPRGGCFQFQVYLDPRGAWRPRPKTWFARLREDNPAFRVLSTLGPQRDLPLARWMGLGDSSQILTLPLDWGIATYSVAQRDGDGKPVPYRLDSIGAGKVRTSLEETATQILHDDEGDESKGDRDVDTYSAARALRIAGGVSSALLFFGLYAMTVRASKITDAVDTAARRLRDAADPDLYLNEVIAELLHIPRAFDFTTEIGFEIDPDGLSFVTGITAAEADVLRIAFTGSKVPLEVDGVTQGVTDQEHAPVVMIGSSISASAGLFARDMPEVDPLSTTRTSDIPTWLFQEDQSYTANLPNVPSGDVAAAVAFGKWAQTACPSRDAGILIDTIAIIVGQLVNIDDMILAFSGLAGGDGLLASAVRRTLREGGVDLGADSLRTVSISRVVQYVVRQVLTDFFVQFATAQPGADVQADCLYKAFCWTNTTEKLEATEEVFGPLVSAPSLASLADTLLLPEVKVRQVFLGTGRSALQNLMDALTDGDLKSVSPCAWGTIRSWILLQGQDCQASVLEDSIPASWAWPAERRRMVERFASSFSSRVR